MEVNLSSQELGIGLEGEEINTLSRIEYILLFIVFGV